VATAMIKDIYDSKSRETDLSYGPIHGFDISDSSPGPWRASAEVHVLEGSVLGLGFHRPAGFGRKYCIAGNNRQTQHGLGAAGTGVAWYSRKESRLFVSAHFVFSAEHIHNGVHSLIVLYLYKWFWAQPAGLQLLFCRKRHWNDRWADAVYASI
jgi:hypothetical protein